jgi:hypothetical protein
MQIQAAFLMEFRGFDLAKILLVRDTSIELSFTFLQLTLHASSAVQEVLDDLAIIDAVQTEINTTFRRFFCIALPVVLLNTVYIVGANAARKWTPSSQGWKLAGVTQRNSTIHRDA